MSCMPTLLERAHFSPAPRFDEVQEAEQIQPVSHRHDDDVFFAREVGAFVQQPVAGSAGEAAAVQPHHHRSVAVPRAGVKTFRLRQSSPIGSCRSRAKTSEIGPSGSCGERFPTWKQSRMPLHGASFAGGMKRFAPCRRCRVRHAPELIHAEAHDASHSTCGRRHVLCERKPADVLRPQRTAHPSAPERRLSRAC